MTSEGTDSMYDCAYSGTKTLPQTDPRRFSYDRALEEQDCVLEHIQWLLLELLVFYQQ